jgi:hypothetical protein
MISRLLFGLLLSGPALAAPTLAPPPPPAPASPADAPEEGPAVTALSASLVLKVGVPEDAATALIAKADALGGWFQSRNQTSVSFRVPGAQSDAFLAYAATLGIVADRGFNAQDLTGELVDLRARLNAREKVLDGYYAVLTSANPKAVVSVERQITGLIAEIEQLQGRIRFLEHQGEYARVDISFQFRDRQAPARDGSSSFAWLNTMNLQDLVSDFRSSEAWWDTAPASPVTPDGFYPWKKTSHYRAVTPDGVMYRVRSTKHKPAAELEFWKEALKERMVAAGYTVAGEQDVSASGVKGALLELRAPLGQQDWTYLVGVFPDGKKLVIVESAAEITLFEKRKAAVIAAIGQMGL